MDCCSANLFEWRQNFKRNLVSLLKGFKMKGSLVEILEHQQLKDSAVAPRKLVFYDKMMRKKIKTEYFYTLFDAKLGIQPRSVHL